MTQYNILKVILSESRFSKVKSGIKYPISQYVEFHKGTMQNG